MNSNKNLAAARKSKARTMIIDDLVNALTNRRTFDRLDLKHSSEDRIRSRLDEHLYEVLVAIHGKLAPTLSEDTIKEKAKRSLVWEGDATKTINNTRFLGTQHRPDFKLNIGSMQIAVEVKLGQIGSDIRDGVGQSLVYVGSGDYNFVIYLLADRSTDSKIYRSLSGPREAAFIQRLWDDFNIRFQVVCPFDD